MCQNRSCRQQGGVAVFAAFQTSSVTDITVIDRGCLGECGSDPVVLVMPEQIWYGRAHPSEGPVVVERHLQDGRPVESMLYPKYHQPNRQT